jgi:hypothetical protein
MVEPLPLVVLTPACQQTECRQQEHQEKQDAKSPTQPFLLRMRHPVVQDHREQKGLQEDFW